MKSKHSEKLNEKQPKALWHSKMGLATSNFFPTFWKKLKRKNYQYENGDQKQFICLSAMAKKKTLICGFYVFTSKITRNTSDDEEEQQALDTFENFF